MPLLYGKGFDPLYEKRKSTQAAGGGDSAQQSMESLQQKYLAQIPKADIPSDPEKIYGSMMAPARQDVNRATEQIGLGLQKHATGGSSYEDMLSRYLPGAIEPMADLASKSATAGQEFGQRGAIAQNQADVARVSVANEMAAAERQMQDEQRRFMLDLKARISMAEREISAKERIALQGARSQEHIARINNNAAMERQRVIANAQMETQKYSQTQQNYRNNLRMQVWDKQVTGQNRVAMRRENRYATEFASRYPNVGRTGVGTTGKPLPQIGTQRPGTGSWRFGDRSGQIGPSGFQDTQAYPGMDVDQGYYGPPQSYPPFEPFTQEQKDARAYSNWR